ncbi:hypothetical protein [Isoptericola sediminis]|uniref:Transcriptional regulator with AbiEi antitoxin domain of type IV toxin-antitoxin system n=1 Tax=Isoptericola sediminis TaxID=2733572 RepID=A0A849JZI9_9MICO|nr:hypothetical protein [Isoptericola sediminis]NNU28706.1 hypothetical protein [Isoptericola sediminis]
MPAVPTSAPRPLRELLHGPGPAPPVVRPGDVGGRAAWQTLVHEGVLRVLRADAACPAGRGVDAALRASVLAPEVPAGAVVTARTAVWVHTGRGRPETLDLTYPAGRHRPERPRGARLWQGHLLGPDTRRLGGVAVTTPQRTLVELVLHGARYPETPLLAAALLRAGADPGRARRAIEARSRVAARGPAHAALSAAAATLVGVEAAHG